MENMEIMRGELKREDGESIRTVELSGASASMELEAAEQREMNAFTEASGAELDVAEQRKLDALAEASGAELEAAEQREMDEGAKLGYSSRYYEHKMASALKNGNKIAYDNAERHWAKAKVKEETRK